MPRGPDRAADGPVRPAGTDRLVRGGRSAYGADGRPLRANEPTQGPDGTSAGG
ncbi:hypothetical protein SBD_4934 [Streptomyces bottropensis ATCC 25435]|uniref:Uncharacterized protein n=1 Tax=Streptomyces bottropensis ATCC 25435 TaxID=1054862 RepID=M3EB27_9ACTN|nr:hypothetical protein SBD_4934 [Streptomyces bottropensis ATCC 25435]